MPIVVKKRRKAMPSTTCGIISGDMKKARDRLAAGESDSARWRAPPAPRTARRSSRTALRATGLCAEGAHEFRIVGDRPEPAQRQPSGRQRQIAFRREGDDADDHDRRQHEDDKERMKDLARSGPLRPHRNTSA